MIVGTVLITLAKVFNVIKKPVGVTDAELAVLKTLWARGPLTAKAIT
jgi:hypothetical protein